MPSCFKPLLDPGPPAVVIRPGQHQMHVLPLADYPGHGLDQQVQPFFEINPSQEKDDFLGADFGKSFPKGARGRQSLIAGKVQPQSHHGPRRVEGVRPGQFFFFGGW